MSKEHEIFKDNFDFESAVRETKTNGYYFQSGVLATEAQNALETEINLLPLEVGDHINKPINNGKPNEVRQQHARAYFEYGDPEAPVANFVINCLAQTVQAMPAFPELENWQPTEIGYQKYRSNADFIGPHRDRSSDQLLSVTFTISGAATVKIFESLGACNDYTDLLQADEFETSLGGIMLLRAPGLGCGKQSIHQVLPPSTPDRSILNLRMRPTVLEQPTHPKWQA